LKFAGVSYRRTARAATLLPCMAACMPAASGACAVGAAYAAGEEGGEVGSGDAILACTNVQLDTHKLVWYCL
jgi:hypothetical protein